MTTRKISNLYYEIKSLDGAYGLPGTFETEDEALAEINTSYIRAKERGYDNRHERWAIFCVKTVRTFLENGDFYKEETTCTRVTTAEFDEYTETYCFPH